MDLRRIDFELHRGPEARPVKASVALALWAVLIAACFAAAYSFLMLQRTDGKLQAARIELADAAQRASIPSALVPSEEQVQAYALLAADATRPSIAIERCLPKDGRVTSLRSAAQTGLVQAQGEFLRESAAIEFVQCLNKGHAVQPWQLVSIERRRDVDSAAGSAGGVTLSFACQCLQIMRD